MTTERIEGFLLLAVFIAGVMLSIWQCTAENRLLNNIRKDGYTIKEGEITGSRHGTGRSRSSSADYAFDCDNIEVKGSRSLSIEDKSVGSGAYIVVSKKDSTNSFLLYYPNEFEEFGMKYPDKPFFYLFPCKY